MSGATASNHNRTEIRGVTELDRKAIVLYVGAVTILAGLVVVQAWQGGLGSDIYLHLSVFRELSIHPLDPSNPYVSSPDPTLYFSPYSVVLGLIGRITGASPIMLYHLGAALNLGLLATGFWMLARSFSRYRWTPHLLLFLSLLAWGLGPWKWSGFWSLNSIGFGLGYPSMFASGLSLIALAGLYRYFSRPDTRVLAASTVAATVITVSHLLTAVWFGVAVLAIVAAQSKATLRTTALPLLAAAFAAGVLVLIWPYYSILDLLSEASNSSAVHGKLYQNVAMRGILLIPGLVALTQRARTPARDPLVWMFMGGTAAYLAGYVFDFYALGRVIPLIFLSAHIALADLLGGWVSQPNKRKSAVAALSVIGLVGLLGSSSGLFWMTPRGIVPSSALGIEQPVGAVSPYRQLQDALTSADVAFASLQMSRVVPSVTGRVVVPGYLTPLLSDREARARASILFFADRQSAVERDAIAARWNASHIVVEPADLVAYPWLKSDYSIVSETDAYVVFVIEPRSENG